MGATLDFERNILAAQQGDPTAFAKLVDATRNVVCSITLAIVHDIHASEDVAQDVFLEAWSSVGKLRNPQSFLPWLRQITRNRAHEFLRSRSRYGRRHATWYAADAVQVVDQATSARERLIDDEERRALTNAIESLPDEAREIVTLFYREGNSIRQVAELLGLTEDTVKKRLERARVALRDAMLRRFAEIVRKSAPGAAFTAAVTAAISVGGPTTATAASAGLAKSLTGVGWGKFAALAAGPALGGISAIGGILFGLRKYFARARSYTERRALTLFAKTSVGVTMATCVAWIVWAGISPGPTGVIVPFAGFSAVMWFSYEIWLPRIIAPRLAIERLEDPEAWERQRKERIRARIGMLFGFLVGTAALVYGLLRYSP